MACRFLNISMLSSESLDPLDFYSSILEEGGWIFGGEGCGMDLNIHFKFNWVWVCGFGASFFIFY